jgi:asparagine synthase (glutamine-hydrolysing)
MCGINAIFAYRPDAAPVDERELLAVRDAMTPRGPDGAGTWLSDDQRIGFGHRRLAIIDPSPAGAQPMLLEDTGLVITFNGEIYNYRALRAELIAAGCTMRTNTDTEVILHLYRRHGPACVNHLRGMFAFVIRDRARHGLLLARDPLGIKPLYLADDGSTLRIASQVKALLSGGTVDTAPDPAGHVGFYLWGHVPDPFTLFRRVRALPAGSTLWCDEHGPRQPRSYFSVAATLAEAEPAPVDLHEVLIDSVRHHLVADVPVGLFLSAGRDSTVIAALAAEAAGPDLRTLTLGFDRFRGTAYDETVLAEEAARAIAARHETRLIGSTQFAAARDHLFASMDQPSVDGVNVYFVARAAHEAGMKVALSGLGGDEMFAGYPSFAQIPRLTDAIGRLGALRHFGRAFRVVGTPLLRHLTSPKFAGLLEYGGSYSGAFLLRRGLFMPWELPRLLDGEIVRAGWAELEPLVRLEREIGKLRLPRQKVTALEISAYMQNRLLRDADWAGMCHSLEIRTPLVDAELLRRLAPALAGTAPPSKADMFATVAAKLPPALAARPKTGFFVPVRAWLEGRDVGRSALDLRDWARRVHRDCYPRLAMPGA